MRVIVAGATGVIGRPLVPRLISAGHTVGGMTRHAEKAPILERAGAEPLIADALDAEAVAHAVATFRPDAIIHELTALGTIDMRRFDEVFAMTNRLRTEGTDNLLAAGRAVDVKHFVAQSFAGWPFERAGSPVKSEGDRLDPRPAAGMRRAHSAIRHLETHVLAADWTNAIVLRYGNLYGDGTSLGPGGDFLASIEGGRLPIIGNGSGVWSFIHVDDAADATVLSLERGKPGLYQIVDDDPAAVAVWLPRVAHNLGAPAPRRVPRWIGRLAAGEVAALMMTEVRGASNDKAKRELGWVPRHPSWRDALGVKAA
jgi:nucleoside-diphosphate-sugar epimerase